ncbi:MAG: anti-sigma factor [Caldilineaceae bacterium]
MSNFLNNPYYIEIMEFAMTQPAVKRKLDYRAIIELLPDYTQGVLEAEEMLAVDEYLRRHQHLLEELKSTDETMAHLALTTQAVTPTDDVKKALLSRVHSSLSNEPTIELRSPSAQEQEAAAPAESATRRPQMTWLDQLRYELGGGLTWPTSTALAVLACLLLAVLSVQMWRNQRIAFSRLDTVQQSAQALGNQNAQLQSANDEILQKLSERDQQLGQFATAMRSIALEGTEFAPQAGGAFYAGKMTGVLILSGLAPLPPEQTYQLWLIPADGDPVSAGLIQVTDDGVTITSINMDSRPQDFAAVGLSIEPVGGSPQPTGPIVLLGTVSS